jgi:hypothetical protein
MYLRNLRDRALDSSRRFFYSEIRIVRLVSRLFFLSLSAALLALISSAVANELNLISGTQQEQSQMVVAPSQSIDQSPESDSSTVIEETPTSSISPEASPTPEPTSQQTVSSEPVEESTTAPVVIYIDEQPKFNIKIPASIAVDPRAKSVFLPNLQFSGAPVVLACLTGSGITFDAGEVRNSNDQDSPNISVSGDMTSLLRVSGEVSVVRGFINSLGGLFVSADGTAIAGRSFDLALVALTEKSTEIEYCGGARTSVSSVFRALGLDLSTKKGSGTLK